VHWLSQVGQISLIEEGYSFHELALRWMRELWQPDGQPARRPAAPQDRWPLSRKFLDYLEANAEEYAEVPRFELAPGVSEDNGKMEEAGEDQAEDLFRAAYENVTYRDSTDDGFMGELLDSGQDASDFELAQEAERIAGRLAFLATLAELWRSAALASMSGNDSEQRDEVLLGWLRRATANHQGLLGLLRAVQRYPIPLPRGTLETLVEYDHRRAIKEVLLEQIVTACVETADAGRMIRAAIRRPQPVDGLEDWEEPAARVLHALVRGDREAVRSAWEELIEALLGQPLLYVALGRGGSPARIVASRNIHYVLRRLLGCLPRLGMLSETAQLIEVAQDMELENPVGRDAVTEFDQLFRIGFGGIVQCLVVSSDLWGSRPGRSDLELIDCLEQVTEALLRCWLVHSRGVRLSVLEAVGDRRRWAELKQFIERYGGDLFTQHFMNFGNLRGILHQGVGDWLRSLQEELGSEEELRLLVELDGPLKRADAIRHLGLALEAVVENYAEYVDYNSITTQSDRGDMLYTLLDFLRLRASYDRVAWNLQPVMLAHGVLVRCGRDEAAVIWRDAVSQRTAEIADEHLKRLSRLCRKYGMRLPSIADRLGERFVRPLTIDRLRALVRPAIEALGDSREAPAFRRLEEGVTELTEEPAGAGLEVPAWLEALEEEARQTLSDGPEADTESLDPYLRIPQAQLSLEEARRQVEHMASGEW
jgi:hypothetical protein